MFMDSGSSDATPNPEEGPELHERILKFCDQWDRVILADGHEAAFIGVIDLSLGNETPKAVYDLNKVIDGLESQGMERDVAWEFYDYNIAGAWVGPETPVFLVRFDED